MRIMINQKTNKKGYFLTEEEYQHLEEVEVDGKKFYFLACKWSRGKLIQKDEVLNLIRQKKNKEEICIALDIKMLQLNNFLTRNFSTMRVDLILKDETNQ